MPASTKPADLYELIHTLGQQGQTAFVALATQTLDNELEKVIIARMPNHDGKMHRRVFDYPAPLASFAAKIDVAFAFGIIDQKLHSTLTNIRYIRNAFAHPKDDTHFRSPHIKEMLKKFDGYNDVVDPYALFGNEFRECRAALSLLHVV